MKKQPWLEEQWQALSTAQSQEELLRHVYSTAKSLGFDYCSFVLSVPYPLTTNKSQIVTNYPDAWQQIYETNHYIDVDPIVQHCLHSTSPLTWSGNSFKSSFWEEALSQGIGHGWSQAHCNTQKVWGMLSLARFAEPICAKELIENQPIFAWLTQVAYAGFYPFMASKLSTALDVKLTGREKEVLRWTADGKTAGQIADILNIRERTVNFHINHILDKLGAANKIAATVQAVILGLI